MADLVLDERLIEGFVAAFLQPRFDNPQPIPNFHRELWKLCCSADPNVVIAAPRGHGKSTAITHSYALATLLFKVRDFALIVSDTEGQAVAFLHDIKVELQENEDLIAAFGIKKFHRDAETEIVVELKDGHQFKVMAKGSEQKVRGLKWRNKRPNLIIGDDLENDEIVMNKERREKFRKWLFNALLPCGGDDAIIRIVGTVLHLDAALERLLNDPAWLSVRYRAHKSFNEFIELLWPEKWSEARLRSLRQRYINQGNPDGYSQEMLNDPIAEGETYFREQDFIAMEPEDFRKPMTFYAAADFAISEKEKADRTVTGAAGIDADGILYIMDVRKGRWDSLRICDEIFSIQKRYEPEIFGFETEKIDKALGPFLNQRMMAERIFINIKKMTPSKSKLTRARSIQARMRAGAVRFNKEADWYPEFEAELMQVTTEGVKGKHDDQFDWFAWIGLMMDEFVAPPTPQEEDEEEYMESLHQNMFAGRDVVCGY